MRTIKRTTQFKKDYKREAKGAVWSWPIIRGAGLAAAAFALVAGAVASPAAAPAIDVTLAALPDGKWRVDYALARPARRLDLGPALGGFRARDWRIETAGLALVSEDGRDVLVPRGKRATFDRASLTVSARPSGFEKQYEAIRVFAGGAVLYTGHFWPYTERARADASFTIIPRPGGRVYAFGDARGEFRDWQAPTGHPAFVYVGPLEAAGTAIVDPTAPAWAVEDVVSLAPRLVEYYARAFGRELASAPDLFVLTDGDSAPGRLRFDGDALPGQIEIALSGGAWASPDRGARTLLARATAHEAAHLWQTAARPARNDVPDWIHEGGADALALEALVAIGAEPAEALAGGFDAARASCAAALDGRSLAAAEKHGSWRASYACGAALSIIAARAVDATGTVADFWRVFISRAAANGGYDEALFLALIEEKAGRDVAAAVRLFPRVAYAAPEKELARLYELAGAP
ncbi:MAG: hypothetical protein WD076_04825 [Parvularculaceae bacterium]